MRRRLFQLLTGLSLLLALATAALWIRSGWSDDRIWHHRVTPSAANGSAGVQRYVLGWSNRGRLLVQIGRTDHRNQPAGTLSVYDGGWKHSSAGSTDQKFAAGVLGFTVSTDSRTFAPDSAGGPVQQGSATTLQLPHWSLVLLFSILPTIAATRWLRHRRHLKHLGPDAKPCPACGYDCRASSGRCPECGRGIDEAAAIG